MTLHSCFQPASLTPHPAPLHMHVSVPSSLHSLLSSSTCVLELICPLSVCLSVSLSCPSFTLCFGSHLSSVCLSVVLSSPYVLEVICPLSVCLSLSLILSLSLSLSLSLVLSSPYVFQLICPLFCLSVSVSIYLSVCLLQLPADF